MRRYDTHLLARSISAGGLVGLMCLGGTSVVVAQASSAAQAGQLHYGMEVQVISAADGTLWSDGVVGTFSRDGKPVDACPVVMVRRPRAPGYHAVPLRSVLRLRVPITQEPTAGGARSAVSDSTAVEWIELRPRDLRARHPECFG
jgi:hypothetical protein